LPEVLTASEHERKRKPLKTEKKTTGVVPQQPSPVVPLSRKIYILQDPDLKSFVDQIILNGRAAKRECKNGILKTEDPELMRFQMKNGYFLIETQEAENG
jgi:hypothetical protein